MLRKRIIPKLLLRPIPFAGREKMVLVTTRQFSKHFEVGDPVSQARIYESQAADELIFLDIDASNHKRGTLVEVVRRAAEEIFMPFTVGGGVRSLEDINLLLGHGADKVSINTAALENPSLLEAGAAKFGSQCVVASIDYRIGSNGAPVVTASGLGDLDRDPLDWAKQCESLGAGEILLTSVDRDGTGEGLDTEMIRKVSESVKIPVIASGGCGRTQHFIEGFTEGKADAISAGTYFCFKDENPMQTRAQIKNAGIPIRIQ